MPSFSPDTFRKIVWASALYDLIVTAPFATPWSFALAHGQLSATNQLLGGAALPAHFPPYAVSEAYWALTNKRVAAILRNGRHAARLFARKLASLAAELHFVHGLYVTLRAGRPLDEAGARQAAEALSHDLSQQGYPIRHAGSFGFDFAATEWFHDATTDQYSVRVAVPDLPSELWNDLTAAIARWWRAYQSTRGRG